MAYGLLYVEVLLVCLLWVAWLLACAFHARKRRERWLLVSVAIIPLVLFFGCLTAAAAYLKFAAGFEENRFAIALTLFIAFVTGATVLFLKAARRPEPGLAPAAAGWSRARLAMALLTVATLTIMTIWNMDLEAKGRAAALKVEAGTLLLAVAPPPINDSQNAAILYEKAFQRMQADKSMDKVNSPLNVEVPDFNDHATLAMLARHERTIALLRQGAALPDCRFEHDYAHPSITMLLPELNRVRGAARLLQLHARYEVSRGHVDSAMVDVSIIFRLARDIGGEPLVLISSLVAVGLDAMAVNLLQEVLPAVTSNEQLASLNIGDPDSLRRILRRSLDGEEAFGLSIFSDMVSGERGLAFFQGIGTPVSQQAWVGSFDLATGTFFRLFFLSEDLNAYRRVMEEYRSAAALPYDEGREAVLQAEKSLQPPRRTPLTSLIAPGISSGFRSTATAQASHAAAAAAIAMTRFRLDHGSYPAKLEELIPKYLDDVPPDPFDGKPLKYVIKDGQWIIYSIGPDGKDDGGAPFSYSKHTGDVGFTLKLPAVAPTSRPA